MSRNISPMINGGILVVLGCILLAGNLYDFDVEMYWPMFFLIPVLLSLGAFLSNRRNAGALVPFGLFVVIGAMFQYCAVFGWHDMSWLWPGFIFAPGVGLFLLYLANRERGLLIPVGILTGISAVFFVTMSPYKELWPVLLIIAGGALLLYSRKSLAPRTEPTLSPPPANASNS